MLLKLTTSTEVDGSNPVEGDLHLSAGKLVRLGTGAALDPAEVAQRIRCRFRFFKLDYFLDPTQGLPWFEEIFEKGVSPQRVISILRRVPATTPGVVSVPLFVIDSLDRVTRKIFPRFEAQLDSGFTLKSTDFGPFVVGV